MVVFATHAPKHRACQQRDHTSDRDKQAQMRRIGQKDWVEVLDSGDGDSHDAEQGENSAQDFHVVPHLWRVGGASDRADAAHERAYTGSEPRELRRA